MINKLKWKILLLIIVALLVLLVIVAIRALLLSERQFQFSSPPPYYTELKTGSIHIDDTALARQLARLVRIKTVAGEQFDHFHKLLETLFPRVHATLARKQLAGHSLLYHWRGRNPKLRPILLMAHMDVVPATQGSEKAWRYPPFSGAMNNGYVWGRGTLDDKAALLCIMAATEKLLAAGLQPERGVLIALSHDEETAGSGARAIVAELKRQNIKPLLMLDEWSPVVTGKLLGSKKPVALIGVAEKGYMTLKLTARGQAGHSSKPTADSAVNKLVAAITALNKHPMPAVYRSPLKTTLAELAPHAEMKLRMVVANSWLLEPVLLGIMAGKPETNALIRSTITTTMLTAGVRENVIPQQAQALVNVRLLPGDKSKDVIKHIRNTINDRSIRIEKSGRVFEAPPVSSSRSRDYHRLAKVIHFSFPDAVIVPSLMIGTTDSRYYRSLGSPVYRFRPFKLKLKETHGIHGVNERIRISSLRQGVWFYVLLISEFSQKSAVRQP